MAEKNGKKNGGKSAGAKTTAPETTSTDKDTVVPQTHGDQEIPATMENNDAGSDAGGQTPTEALTREQMKNEKKAKDDATGHQKGKTKVYYSGKADYNVSNSKASAIFDSKGFYTTSNPATIEMLDEHVENGFIQDRTNEFYPEEAPKKEKASEPVNEIDRLKAEAKRRNIAFPEDVTVEELQKAIAAHEDANPGSGKGMTSFSGKK